MRLLTSKPLSVHCKLWLLKRIDTSRPLFPENVSRSLSTSLPTGKVTIESTQRLGSSLSAQSSRQAALMSNTRKEQTNSILARVRGARQVEELNEREKSRIENGRCLFVWPKLGVVVFCSLDCSLSSRSRSVLSVKAAKDSMSKVAEQPGLLRISLRRSEKYKRFLD